MPRKPLQEPQHPPKEDAKIVQLAIVVKEIVFMPIDRYVAHVDEAVVHLAHAVVPRRALCVVRDSGREEQEDGVGLEGAARDEGVAAPFVAGQAEGEDAVEGSQGGVEGGGEGWGWGG